MDIPSWVPDSVFYQIFPDRFARSGRVPAPGLMEDWNSPPTVYGFKGGDLYGVAERLEYLQDVGITALYLCPIFSSAANHRYHTYDYFSVDPLLGGNAALRELIDEAHRRGMRIVLDGVFNHCGRGFWPFHHVLENGEASPYRDWFHFDPAHLNRHRPFQPYPSDDAARQLAEGRGSLETVGYAAWWNLPALPKFNTNCPAVREFLLSVGEHWVEFGIDGWRLDVPNEIDDDEFWREFRRRIRKRNPAAYIVGEVWGEAQRWLHGDMWDAVMNYQITAACLGFFGGDSLDLQETRRPSSFGHVRRLTAPEFADEVRRLATMYSFETTTAQLNLLDSHDMPRFITCCRGDRTALQLAWLFVCLIPGAPCIYYGDEVGLEGRHDPDCRRGFPWSKETQNPQLLQWFKDCIRLRRRRSSLRHTPAVITPLDNRAVMIEHADVVAVLNPSTSELLVPLPQSVGATWRDAMSGEPNSGRSIVTVAARSALVVEAPPIT
ncbi:MAG: glycoside hydrolase family 13 protein [Planctomycetaceae bacterium]|nr:glycoside hydrolase family 13 protein [Planctomycetaceae bacterium]